MEKDQLKALLVLFGLPRVFSEGQLKQSYRDLVQVWHPDRHSKNDRLRQKAEEKLKEINDGERILSSLLVNGRFDLESVASVETWTPTRRPPPAPASPPMFGLPFSSVAIVSVGILLAGLVWALKQPAKDTPSQAAGPRIVKSPRLDDRNGFKQFVFGMAAADAAAIQAPDEVYTDDDGTQSVLVYNHGTVTAVGDFPLDRVELEFSRDQLHRIEIRFSRNADKIYQAFVTAFGGPNEGKTWTRNGHAVRARFWQGDNLTAAVLAEPTSAIDFGWDSVVISDNRLDESAVAAGKDSLARAITPDGFKSLTFGMSAVQVRALLGRNLAAVDDGGVGATRIDVPAAVIPQIARLGVLPVDEIRCHFFNDQLYRIDLAFTKNIDDFYRAFDLRFPQAARTNNWTRGTAVLSAREWKDAHSGAVIVAPSSNNPHWDRIILFQTEIIEQRKAFDAPAPARAAQDI